MYYKRIKLDKQEVFVSPSEEIIDKLNLIQIDEDEFNKIVKSINTPSNAQKMENFKSLRDSALKDVDFYQLALVYAELTAKQKKELKAYRLALLDSTKTQILPTKPDWFK